MLIDQDCSDGAIKRQTMYCKVWYSARTHRKEAGRLVVTHKADP